MTDVILLRKSHTYLKRWVMAIRAGRERYYIAYPIIEDFTNDVT